MPYLKTAVSGRRESYKIKSVYINVESKTIQVNLTHVSYDSNGAPNVENLEVRIQNSNELVVDPDWTATSTPPRPDNFDENDPSTWDTLTESDIPRVNNPDKQYYDIVSASQDNVYNRVKNALYDHLKSTGDLPDGSSWRVV